MIGFATSFITGIVAFKFFPFFPLSILTACILVGIFSLLRASQDKKVFSKKALLIVLIFASGFIYTSVRDKDIPEIKFPRREVQVEGTLIDVPEISHGKARFTLSNVSIEGRPIKGEIRFSAPPEILQGSSPGYGDVVRTFTRLKEPHVFLNPNVSFHHLDEVVGRGYVKNVEIVSEGKGLLIWLWKERQALARVIDDSISCESGALHKAIVLGLQRGVTPEMRDAFIATGLAHLLSVSGTHFALLAFILFTLTKAIIRSLPVRILTKMTLYVTPTQIAIVLTMPVLILYALISGASTPTIRSFIVVFIYMGALFLGRKGQWLNSLSIAAIIILLWEPQALFDISFQLSFLAVLAIGYVLEKAERTQNPEHITGPKKSRKTFQDAIKTSILITIAAVMGTAPIVAYYFHQFPLISPLTNLTITPFVCFVVLPLGLFAGFLSLLFNMNPMPLSHLIDTITNFALELIKIASHIPYSNLHIQKPSIIIIALYFLSLAIIIRGSGLNWKSGLRLAPLAFVLCIYILSASLSTNSLRITFLDVGQGDSAVIELPDKRVMLIDGGEEAYDVGRRVVAPYLWSNGIRKVDYMVLSHPHPDHYGGLIYIMDNFRVGEVWWSGRRIQEAEGFFEKVSEEKIPLRILKRGDVLYAKDYKIYVLHPYDEFYADSPRGEFSNQNNDSLVLKIESSDATVLFTGDIEMEAERDLIHLREWLRSDIIKVPHHGGGTSSSSMFLRVVNPKIAVISVGRNNLFNHPHRETLKRYTMMGAEVLRTDNDGAVTITFKDKRYEIKTYKDGRFKEVRGLGDEIRNLRLLL